MSAQSETEYVYGLNPAFELLLSGRRAVYRATVNSSSASAPRMKKLLELLAKRGVPCELVEKGRLFDLCRSHDHQGVVLAVDGYPYATLEDMLGEPRILLLDNIEDVHNVGAILRSAEVFGYRAVCLPARGTPGVYPSVVKISAGASEHLLIAHNRSANQYARAAAEAGYSIAVLDAKGDVELAELARQPFERMMLVIGGEDKSVGQFILNMADCVVRIGQRGRIGSLNASVSAAIALHALQGGGGAA
jgi:23S rRNA (guanosine2251-2'-O)-methyltransferase